MSPARSRATQPSATPAGVEVGRTPRASSARSVCESGGIETIPSAPGPRRTGPSTHARTASRRSATLGVPARPTSSTTGAPPGTRSSRPARRRTCAASASTEFVSATRSRVCQATLAARAGARSGGAPRSIKTVTRPGRSPTSRRVEAARRSARMTPMLRYSRGSRSPRRSSACAETTTTCRSVRARTVPEAGR